MAVALYIRVSTQEQANEGYSVGEQEDRLKSYCKAVSWSIYKVYTDPGFTGSNMNRPALQQLLHDAGNGFFNKVVVYKLDRLSRSQKDTLELIEDRFLKNGIDFVSISENFDTGSPFGRAMIGILAVFAQLEREQIKERMHMGKVARAKEGKWSGGSCKPIGYDYMDGELCVNEYEKMQIRMIFDYAKAGKSPYQIYKLMANYKTKYGSWNDVSVRKVLKSKVYCGFVKFSGEWYQGNHEQIISIEEWEEVQKIMKSRGVLRLNPGKATSYLGGFLYCEHCGGKYTKCAGRKKASDGSVKLYNYYECNSRTHKHPRTTHDVNCKNKIWKMDDLDEIVFEQIRKLRFNGEISKSTDSHWKINSLEKKSSQITAQIEKIIDLYALDKMPVNLLNAKIEALIHEREEIEKEIDALNQDHVDPEKVRLLICGFDEILNAGNFCETRNIIEALIDHISLDNDDVSIYWKL